MTDTAPTPPATRWRLQGWPRRAAIALAALLLLWALLWLAGPPLLKSQAQSRLSALLGRSVTIGAVDLRPWSLELTVTDLAIGPAPGASQPLLQVARLYVNADAASLWRRAPVLSALEVDAPVLQVARLADGRYDLDDLLAKFAADPAAPPAPAEPLRLALYNVQLRDGRLSFDDRPVARVHQVDGLQLMLPFVSTIPADVEVTVEPRLAFRLNGTAFDSGAQATPFAQQRSGELKLAFADLDLVPYLGYLPQGLPVALQRGAVSADLTLRFELPRGGEPAMLLRGSAQAADIALAEPGGAALLGWQKLQLGLRDVQPLARRLVFGQLRVDGLQLDLRRDEQGRVNLASLAAPPAPAAAVSAPASAPAASAPVGDAGRPWQVELERFELADARLRWNDALTRPAAALQLESVALQAGELRWPLQGSLPVTLSATLRPQAEGAAAAGTLRVEGRVGPREAQAELALEGLALDALAPYVAQALVPTLSGRLALQAQAQWNADEPALALKVQQATLDGLALTEGSGRAARELFALPQLQWRDALIDLQGRSAALGTLVLSQPRVALQRASDGRWNVQRWAVEAPAAAPAAPDAAASAAPAWRVRLDELAIDGGRLRFDDALASGRPDGDPVQAELSALKLRLQSLAWPGGRGVAPARVQLAARLGAPAQPRAAAQPLGSLAWSGRVAPDPLLAAGSLTLERFPVQLFEPYFGEAARVSLLHADAGAKLEFSVQAQPAGLALKAGGDLRLADVRVHTRAEAGARAGDASTSELLSWQMLALDGLRFEQSPGGRPALELREATLSDFFAKLVITEQGRFNLSGLAAPAGAASAPAATASAPAPAAAASAPAAADELPIDIAVGGINLVNGRVDFSDRFVRPNYSADLSQLNGRLGAFRSGTREMATLELRGRAAGTALLDIRGALNPTAQPLALDIQAKATDLELAPLSPYAGKYAGYAIERGKLSMDVAYKITPEGRLEARNQVVLNQLTFGEKVDSPDATKLPVLLAVALLKDRNGVIDINLPISGSINDPQFSVFGIVLKVIGNLLVKAITAPFSLLFGGGGEELNHVEFLPGTARPTEAGQAALAKVAKALVEREALKMTVTGAADPVSEREAFQRAALEASLLAQRRRELLRAGSAPAEADAVSTLDAPTRSRMLREVYKAADLPNKPRNALGFAKDIPEPEMEALLRARTVVTSEAMRELALQRGLAVRDALVAQGLPSERLFLAAPKLRASGEDDAAWTPRVQLSLATN
ncbi:MAG: DUF748 domain-containing protein [Piscinibacter sp.]|uniref:DUF748 domain-containing protein n=1 Tax=Piscinibacter sp. TaxID=1903157 RepID=UPI00258FD0C6|nr:DUF748 domain-containing protein [Piscinibacter sp.]MCW5662378.1 DUF748 domain-containing protein [Piscinibacter sp.]